MNSDLRPEQGAIFDLSARTKLRVSGADRLRFLNGQITNDLRNANDSSALYACVLNAKGKINADIFITDAGASFLLDADETLREQLPARLERYVIADDVEISDVTDEFAILHVTGLNMPAAADAIAAPRSARFGYGGTDFWLSRGVYEARLKEWAAELPTCDADCAEAFRIENGIPRWGHELTQEIIPTEANLDVAAISFDKGCYIGQEVISRIKTSGQTNKRLCGLVAPRDGAVEPGMRLVSSDGKDVGWVTSVSASERLGKRIALGFVKRGFNDIGNNLQTQTPENERGTGVEIVQLPFA
ncbi:folate-binding protein YgfZ [soil metagenome]